MLEININRMSEKAILTYDLQGVIITIVAQARKEVENGKCQQIKRKIVECGLSMGELAYKIGIDRATLYRKINSDGQKITIKDADLIAKELKLTCNEVNDIFFSQFVA